MIAKLTTGCDFRGALNYDFDEAKNFKIIAGGRVCLQTDENGHAICNLNDIADDFDLQALLNPAVRKPVYHIVLSWSTEEKIEREIMRDVSRDFLTRIGFGGSQYIITQHVKENNHVHIVVNIVNGEGKRLSSYRLVQRMHQAAAEITKERGFVWGKPATKETIQRAKNPREKARYTAKPLVQDAVSKAKSEDELQRLLEDKKIQVKFKEKNGKRVGISFSFRYGGRKHVFSGTSLYYKLGYYSIIAELKMNSRREQMQSSAKKEPQVPQPDPSIYNGIKKLPVQKKNDDKKKIIKKKPGGPKL